MKNKYFAENYLCVEMQTFGENNYSMEKWHFAEEC